MCVVKIHQGGGVAAPVGGQIFSEILPYLEVNQGNQDEIQEIVEIKTPDFINKSIKEAEKMAKEQNIEFVIENLKEGDQVDKENSIITEQIPRSGITIKTGSKVYVKIGND